jgi:hypothetical protein
MVGFRMEKPMRLRSILAIAATVSVAMAYSVSAQNDHGRQQTGHAAKAAAADGREFVRFPPELVEHTLSNMRDHLLAIQEIQQSLGMGHPDEAAKIAEERLGLSSLRSHGAHDVAKFMPQGMQDVGSGMHRAASRFAIVAKDAGVTGELKPALSALSEVTAQCVGCHAGYRIK